MRLRIAISFLGALTLGLISQTAQARDVIKGYTANLTPYTIDTSIEEPGFTVELLRAMQPNLSFDIEIIFLPFIRAQELVKSTPETLIFTLTFTEERTKSFNYIQPVLISDNCFLTKGPEINSVEEAKSIKFIGTVMGTTQEKFLTDHGITKFLRTTEPKELALMLDAGRLDTWFTGKLRGYYVWKKAGFNSQDLKCGKTTDTETLMFASNKTFDPKKQEEIKRAVRMAVNDGTYKRLYEKYFPGLTVPDEFRAN